MKIKLGYQIIVDLETATEITEEQYEELKNSYSARIVFFEKQEKILLDNLKKVGANYNSESFTVIDEEIGMVY